MKLNIEHIIEETLIAAAQNCNESFVNAAVKVYRAPFGSQNVDMELDQGFNAWLIHDYHEKGRYLVDQVQGDVTIKHIIKNSRYSIYKVRLEKQNIVLKDVITLEDYVLETERYFEENDLMKVRLYQNDDKWIILDEPEFYDQSLEEVIRKSVLTHYNNYCATYDPIHIREFAKMQSQLIYHLTTIIDFYESELNDDESYEVFIGQYATKDKESVLDLLLDDEQFQMIEVDGDETIVHMISENVQFAEVVVTSNRIEIEATSQVQLDMIKSLFENLVGSHAVHIKDEKLKLDDLL